MARRWLDDLPEVREFALKFEEAIRDPDEPEETLREFKASVHAGDENRV